MWLKTLVENTLKSPHFYAEDHKALKLKCTNCSDSPE